MLKKSFPTFILIFFIILVNLVILHRYVGPDFVPPTNDQNPKLPPYHAPYYGLSLVRPKEKKFTSHVLEDYLTSLKSKMKDKDLYVLLQNCLPNTLDTTVEWFNENENDPRTFLITGDIPAMWIRDSSNQIAPYMRFINEDKRLRDLVFGVIQVQATYLNYDPYANAFLRPWYAPKKEGEKRGSTTDHVVPFYNPDIVWESKYELDSIGHFFQLSNDYMESTGDIKRVVTSKDWLEAIPRIFQVLQDQMQNTWPSSTTATSFPFQKQRDDPEPVRLDQGYRFQRWTDRPTETLGEYGIGGITKSCGLVRSAFRPSDDATTFPYLVPSNAQLSVQLIRLSEFIETFLNQEETEIHAQQQQIKGNAKELGNKINQAIYDHAIVEHPVFGKVFAFEVDCYGSQLMMDDANIPSLLSLPVIGFIEKNNSIYRNTREMILSEWNPWYFQGTFGKGIGGPHTGQDMVWPMSLLIQIQTSVDEFEIRELIDLLKRMAKKTGNLMCESFNVNQPEKYTRSWFSWANGLAGTTILQIIQDYPHLA